MSERYYISERRELLAAGRAILTGDEARHLCGVMRAKVGDTVSLFTGDGIEYSGQIERISRAEVELAILDSRADDREPELDLTMAVALPKGDRQKWLIEKLTELGVRRYIPLAVERADIKVDDNVLTRLRRQVIEASKQCGRCRLMEILPEMPRRKIAEIFPFEPVPNAANHLANNTANDSLKILCHPISDGAFGQVAFVDLLRHFAKNANGDPILAKHLLLVIGPVGGFTDAEVQAAADDGWPILDLGRQVYRVETAAICAASLFLHLAK